MSSARLAASRAIGRSVDAMRAVLFSAAVVAAVLAVDLVVFDGHYRQATWRETQYRGQQFSYEVGYFLRKFGLVR
jgi:hypothetical protein